MKWILIFSGLLVSSAVTQAKENVSGSLQKITAKVVAYNKVKGKILVSSRQLSAVKAGDVIKYGKFCTMEVSAKTVARAILLADLCRKKDLPQVGTQVELMVHSSETFTAQRTQVINNNRTIRQVKVIRPVKGRSSSGFRVEVSKPTIEQTRLMKNKVTGESIKESEGNTTAVSGSIGYTRVNIGDLGLSSKLTFTHYDSDTQGMRATLNATYGFNEHIYAFAGGNGHKFTRGPVDLDFGAGYQVGAGIQLTANLGLEVGYLQISNEGYFEEDTYGGYLARGVELAIHLTF